MAENNFKTIAMNHERVIYTNGTPVTKVKNKTFKDCQVI
jgi:hypothetical protein